MTRHAPSIAACLLSLSWSLANSASAGASADESTAPIVSIPQGSLRGVRDGELSVFKGIPYAAAPVGELRWRAPQPPPTWRGVRAASDFGPVCPQITRPGSTDNDVESKTVAEDCLQLNIWTPAPRADAKRPVMVWILPGGFRNGDASMSRYNGANLARRGVVFVSFNYRLGMFGEFAHPALSRAQPNEPLGNYHLQDQLAALRWIKGNIASFGGDPARVTIFGMSAGGMSVNYLMASPLSTGLFSGAVSQSSALRMSYDRKLRDAVAGIPSLESEGIRHASALGIDGDDLTVRRRLRALTVRELIDYQSTHQIGTSGGLSPVIDGQVLVEPVGVTFRTGRQQKVAYLTGATNWEGSLIKSGAAAVAPVLELLNMTRAQADALYHEPNAEILAWKCYTDYFLNSQRYLALAHARAAQPTWVYRFSRVLESHEGDYYGAAHGAETRYVFGTLDGLARLQGPERPGDVGFRITASDRSYADMMAQYWVNFATYGDPNGDGLPGWPAQTPNNDVLLEFMPQQPVVRRDFLSERWQFFRSHFDAGKL